MFWINVIPVQITSGFIVMKTKNSRGLLVFLFYIHYYVYLVEGVVSFGYMQYPLLYTPA